MSTKAQRPTNCICKQKSANPTKVGVSRKNCQDELLESTCVRSARKANICLKNAPAPSRYLGRQDGLFSRKTVEHGNHRQRIMLVIEESPDGQMALDSRFPPEDTFPASIRSCHHGTVYFVKKCPLSFRRLWEGPGLVKIVARLPVAGGFHHDDG